MAACGTHSAPLFGRSFCTAPARRCVLRGGAAAQPPLLTHVVVLMWAVLVATAMPQVQFSYPKYAFGAHACGGATPTAHLSSVAAAFVSDTWKHYLSVSQMHQQ